MGLLTPLAQSSGSGGLAALLPLVLMVGVFYFLLIRPQQRRARSQRQLLESLDVGDEVVTIGGIFGTVRALDDDEVTIEVAPNIELQFLKSAIARKLVLDEDEYDQPDEDAEADQEEREAGGAP